MWSLLYHFVDTVCAVNWRKPKSILFFYPKLGNFEKQSQYHILNFKTWLKDTDYSIIQKTNTIGLRNVYKSIFWNARQTAKYIQWNSEKQIYLYRNYMVINVKSNDFFI